MKPARKMCFDRILPTQLNRPLRTRMIAGRDRAVSLIGKQWPNESTIKIKFLGGTSSQQDMVREVAPIWTKYANLEFEFSDDPRAEVRVSFDENDGAWSYVGTDNLSIPLHAATLNLGWVDQGVILHEFGHMIGLSHEHQNPDGGIEWNEKAVIDALSRGPNFWDESTIRHNVLNKYRADQVHGTDFDKGSVMLYAFPDEWTTNMGGTESNDDLSDEDKAFIASSVMYPGRNKRIGTTATELDIMRGALAEISIEGEKNVFDFHVKQQGIHQIETTGSTDLILSLFGPNNNTRLIGEDDDSGNGRNSSLSVDLSPGKYTAIVRHFDPKAVGEYRIMVSAY